MFLSGCYCVILLPSHRLLDSELQVGYSVRVGFAETLDRISKDAWVGTALQTQFRLHSLRASAASCTFLTWYGIRG